MQKVETLKTARLNGRDVPPGEVVEIDDHLVPFWFRTGLAKSYAPNDGQSDPELPEDLTVLDNGWYLLPNGKKIRGQENALAAYEALKAGDGIVPVSDPAAVPGTPDASESLQPEADQSAGDGAGDPAGDQSTPPAGSE